MPDPRFYRRSGPLTAARIAEIVGADCPPSLDRDRVFADVATLEGATAADVSFASSKDFLSALLVTNAGLCLAAPSLVSLAPKGCAVMACEDPRAAFAKLCTELYPAMAPDWSQSQRIASGAAVDPAAHIAPTAVIGQGARIGPRAVIGPQVVVGPAVEVGADCVIHANASLLYCLIGERVIIHPGARIGQDGFGFYADPTGPKKVPQLGRVIIHDDVEIGANCTIDRGALPDTVIGRGCKLDNLVQIGHNVVLGNGCIVVAQAGIAGSCRIGDGVVLGGQVGLADHVTIGAGAQVASQSGVMRDVGPREVVMGYPAKPIRHFWREVAAIAKLVKRG